MTVKKAIENYLSSCKASGKSENTIESYTATMRMLETWLDGMGVENIEDVTPVHLDAFKNAHSLSVSPTTLNLRLSHVRCLFVWLVDMEVIDRNPMKKSIKVERSALREAQSKEYEKLLDERDLLTILTNNKPRHTLRACISRDRAILALLLTSGIRNTSLRMLTPNDLLWGEKAIRIDVAKGGKSGKAPFTSVARDAVRTYLADHPEIKADQPMFGVSFHDGSRLPYSRQELSNIVENAVCAFTGKPGYRSHAMRHSMATMLAKNGRMQDREISMLLFHSDGEGAAVTNRYIGRDLSWLFEKVDKVFEKALSDVFDEQTEIDSMPVMEEQLALEFA